MSSAMVIADVERAGGHVVVVGILVVLAAAAALIYGLVRLVRQRRTARGARSE